MAEMTDGQMWRIKAPHFVCGIVFDEEGRVVEAAPIVRYMRTWSAERILSYCDRKGWEVEKHHQFKH